MQLVILSDFRCGQLSTALHCLCYDISLVHIYSLGNLHNRHIVCTWLVISELKDLSWTILLFGHFTSFCTSGCRKSYKATTHSEMNVNHTPSK